MTDSEIKVLLLEDNPADCLLLEEALKNDQLNTYELVISVRLMDGMALLATQSFDIVLLDLGLPDSRGLITFELFHKLYPNIPVIVFSGNINETDAIRAVKAGAQDYLVKNPGGYELAARAIRYAIERHKLSLSLQESESRFSKAFHASPVGQLISRMGDGLIMDVNKTFCQMMGFDCSEIIGRTVKDVGIWVEEQQRRKILKALQASDQVQNMEVLYRSLLGEVRIVLASFEKIEINGEECIISTALDITERRRSEQALAESEERLRLSLYASQQGLYDLNAQTGIAIVNPEYAEMLGYEADTFTETNANWLQRLHPDDYEKTARVYKDYIEGKLPEYRTEFRQRTKNGDWKWILSFGKIVEYDAEGKPLRMTGTHTDITERKKAEEKIKHNEHVLRLFVEHSPAAIAMFDKGMRYIVASRRYRVDYRLGEQNLVGRSHYEVFPEMTEEHKDIHRRCLAGAVMKKDEDPLLRADGSLDWVRYEIHPWYEINNEVGGIIFFSEVITERKKSEEQLLAVQSRNNALIENAPDGIVLLDKAANFIFGSPSAYRLFGFVDEEILGKRARNWLHPEDQQKVIAAFTDMLREPGKTITLEYRFRNKSGSYLWLEGHFKNLLADPAVHAVVNNFRDITERKQAEQALHQQLNVEIVAAKVSQRFVNINLENHKEIIRSALASMGVQVGVDRCYIFTYSPAEDTFSNTHEWCAAGITPSVSIGQRYRTQDHPLLLQPILRGEVLNFSSVKDLPDNDPGVEFIKMQGVTSMLSLPLPGEKGVLGLIGFDIIAREHIWQETEIHLLSIVAQIIANGLEHLQHEAEIFALNQTLEKRVHELQLADESAQYRQHLLEQVIQLGKQVSAITDLEECLRAIYQSVRHGLNFDRVGLFLYDPSTQIAQGAYGTDPQGEMVDTHWYVTNVAHWWIWDDALRDPKGFSLIEDYQTSVNPPPDSDMYGVKQYATLACWVGNRPVAMIAVDNLVSQRVMNIADLEALQFFAGYAGLAIENARLKGGLEERVRERTAEVQDLYDSAPAGYHSLSSEGVIIAINQTELNWLGYTHDEMMGRHFTKFISPESQKNFKKNFKLLREHGQLKDLEIELLRKDGSIIPALVSAVAIHDQEGKFISTRSTVMDITERKVAENILRESEERYRKAISAADAVPYGLDYQTNTYTFIGDGIKRLTGYNPSEMTPCLFDEIITETSMRGDLAETSTEAATRMVRSGQVSAHTIWRSDFRILCKDGKSRWLSDTSVQIVDKHGNVTGSIGILQDITERKQVEETLRLANLEMERALRLKDEFLANMSHELRTPLNAILGISESLAEQIIGPLSEKQAHYIHTINESGRHLLELINDILDLSKIEAGKITLDLHTVSINSICESSLRMVKELSQKKRQEIFLDIDKSVINVRADERRLKQMIVNLLSNAVKFTPTNGRIGLEVKGDAERQLVLISIWDNGIGIAENNILRLFQPFTQLDGGLNREHEGTGLGLALVSEMARLHGGSISVQSQLGIGSRFTISLPWNPANRGTGTLPPLPEESPPEGSLSSPSPRATILVVEDTETVVLVVRDYLESVGYRVVVANDGLDGVSLAKRLHPDLILMDVQMPIMDGLEAAMEIRKELSLRDIPIIALTALAMPGDRERCMAAGMNDYLSKPVVLKELLASIKHHLELDKERHA